MADEQVIKHIQVGQKYKVQFEQGATKGIIGFKVEAMSDNEDEAYEKAKKLYLNAMLDTTPAETKEAK